MAYKLTRSVACLDHPHPPLIYRIPGSVFAICPGVTTVVTLVIASITTLNTPY